VCFLALVGALASFAQTGVIAQTGIIEGVVVDSAGAGIAGVDVYFGNAEGKHFETSTDSVGSFRLTVDPGEYGWHFEKEGYVRIYSGSDPDARPVRAGSGQDVPFRIQLIRFATVRVKVLDPDSNPVANADVVLDVVAEKTNGDGIFTFANVKPGSYSLMAKADAPRPTGKSDGTVLVPTWFPSAAQQDLAEKIVVRGGDDLVYEIRLRTALVHRVRGKVVDARGQPIPNITVLLSAAPSSVPINADRISSLSLSRTGVTGPLDLVSAASEGYFIMGRQVMAGARVSAHCHNQPKR
jgi:hypothetical protein